MTTSTAPAPTWQQVEALQKDMQQLWIVIERLNRRVTMLEVQQPREPLSTQEDRIRQVLSGWAL